MDIFTRSDLMIIGRTEDGEAIDAEVFYVVAEAEDGRRWSHERPFPTRRIAFVDDEDFGSIQITIDEDGGAQADKLADRIRARGELNMDHWFEIDPAYGSIAYQRWEATATKSELGHARNHFDF